MLTHKRLLEILNYDPATGLFRWREKISRKVVVGSVAGTITKDGYVHITIGGVKYQGHRLAWFYVHGVWPSDLLDHEDLDGTNNALTNLRDANGSNNQCNRASQRNNKLGVKGVSLHKSGKYVAQISRGGKKRHLGMFDNMIDAAAAYATEANKLHGQFARVS